MPKFSPISRIVLVPVALAAGGLFPATARADDLLAGGMIAHLARGDDFTGPRLLDLLVLGLLVFVVLRLVGGRRRGDDADAPPRSDPRRDDRPEPDREPPDGQSPSSGRPDMYTMAQATWDALKSPGAKPGPARGAATAGPPPGATPDEEFLAGAKLAYGRILAAMAQRDFDDLAHFTTPAFLAGLRNQLPAGPVGQPDILLVEASLEGSDRENGRTVMRVAFTALVREPGARENSERRERWRLVRDDADPNAHWLLDGVERS